NQILEGNQSIIGVMLESNLNHGNQSIPKDLSQLQYGVSVTDACINWEESARSIREMADTLRAVLPGPSAAYVCVSTSSPAMCGRGWGPLQRLTAPLRGALSRQRAKVSLPPSARSFMPLKRTPPSAAQL